MRDDHESRAFEALIVSRLRKGCGDEFDATRAPTLTDEEKKSLKCLQPGFIEDLIKQARSNEQVDEPASDEVPYHDNIEQGELAYGMNRADEITGETQSELDRQRQELLEKLRKEGDAGPNRTSG